MAKWPNHFIFGKPFQKGQMATMSYKRRAQQLKAKHNNNNKNNNDLGPCHTRHFRAQYCDKKVLRYLIILSQG